MIGRIGGPLLVVVVAGVTTIGVAPTACVGGGVAAGAVGVGTAAVAVGPAAVGAAPVVGDPAGVATTAGADVGVGAGAAARLSCSWVRTSSTPARRTMIWNCQAPARPRVTGGDCASLPVAGATSSSWPTSSPVGW